MSKNPYAQRSKDVDPKIKQKLIEQSTFIQENASLYLEMASIPLNGSGSIVTSFNSTPKHSKPISFSSADSVKASLDSNKKVGVLISCSHRRAGGGWLSGSLAQEESVSRSSTWAVQAGLLEFNSWYNQDKKLHWLGQKGALVIDGLFLFDENHQELSSPKNVVFAGVAAANKAALGDDAYWDSEKGIKQRKEQLIESLACAFSAFHQRGVDDVILCAFGTNVFGWKFEDSIECLYEATKLAPNKLNFICAVCNEQKAQLASEIYLKLNSSENPNKKFKP
jgi:uncharacterized protein (TIGR02452 family)